MRSSRILSGWSNPMLISHSSFKKERKGYNIVIAVVKFKGEHHELQVTEEDLCSLLSPWARRTQKPHIIESCGTVSRWELETVTLTDYAYFCRI